MVAHGTPCLGPLTHAGCGALCPSYHRGCYGCFGPMEAPNPDSLGAWLATHGLPERDVVRLYRSFYQHG
jgi:coenzyme F420-reducing hydrogenase gamma subunit